MKREKVVAFLALATVALVGLRWFGPNFRPLPLERNGLDPALEPFAILQQEESSVFVPISMLRPEQSPIQLYYPGASYVTRPVRSLEELYHLIQDCHFGSAGQLLEFNQHWNPAYRNRSKFQAGTVVFVPAHWLKKTEPATPSPFGYLPYHGRMYGSAERI